MIKGYKVGVTTGAGPGTPRLPTWEYKLAFGMKKGVDVLEWFSDVPHELTETQGKALKKMAEGLGMKLLLHGAITVPMEIGDRRYYEESHDVMKRSIEVANYMKAIYVLFHASLYQWVEFITRAEVLLAIEMVDHKGRHVEELLEEALNKAPKFVDWFIEKWGERLAGSILHPTEVRELILERERFIRKEIIEEEYKKRLKDILRKRIVNWYDKVGGSWELAAEIIFHYMIFTKDLLLTNMLNVYKEDLEKEGILFSPEELIGLEIEEITRWFEEFKRKRIGKEFFYGSVSAKYVYGHIMESVVAPGPLINKLKEYDLILTLEIPDARDPRYAGMYNLWRPKQIYTLVKTINDPRIKMTIDFEHIATQAAEPEKEIEDFMRTCPDAGKYIISVHCTTPTPTHGHYPIRIGDEYLYGLLWMLRKTGFKNGFLIFERGAPPPQEEEPVRQSVTALRLMKEQLEKNVRPKDLPLEFYGMEEFKTGLAIERQRAAIREHALDPITGMMFVPEEKWTFLGRRAIERGRRPEEWERERYK